MSINFNIIEGEQDNINYDKFKNDFLNPNMTINDLIKKYHISKNKYSKLRAKICDETGLKSKPSINNNKRLLSTDTDYIHKHRGKFAIIKSFNKKRYYYGTYDNLEVAKKIRDKLVEYSWDKTQLNAIKEEIYRMGN